MKKAERKAEEEEGKQEEEKRSKRIATVKELILSLIRKRTKKERNIGDG